MSVISEITARCTQTSLNTEPWELIHSSARVGLCHLVNPDCKGVEDATLLPSDDCSSKPSNCSAQSAQDVESFRSGRSFVPNHTTKTEIRQLMTGPNSKHTVHFYDRRARLKLQEFPLNSMVDLLRYTREIPSDAWLSTYLNITKASSCYISTS